LSRKDGGATFKLGQQPLSKGVANPVHDMVKREMVREGFRINLRKTPYPGDAALMVVAPQLIYPNLSPLALASAKTDFQQEAMGNDRLQTPGSFGEHGMGGRSYR
jgi:hypothetical protein